MESDTHGGGASRPADEDPGAVGFATGTAQGSRSEPGGAGGQDDPRDPACPGYTVSRGVHGGAAVLAGPRGLSAAGESGGAAGAILQMPGPSHAPRPGEGAAPGAAVLNNRVLQLSLTVPFSSHAEADLARHFLTTRTQLRGRIRKELDVNGRMLVLRLTAEDPGLLQGSIAFCLEQLSLVTRSLQHYGAPVSQHRRGV
ncbi:EKC/KEOPS complex subunit LAGE3-like [Bubalus kerabau]|uniref:EKC/KEOPS complex subunit LAGE3-like n=1 Tax=Bubalus carabanensis TaxID=3119969 RepID=UPI00244EA6EB|nr:EKC/KEOPS complex subunit LAGE3-like [Bubalus carabanensis]